MLCRPDAGVDAASRRGFGKPRRVADNERTAAVGLRHNPERDDAAREVERVPPVAGDEPLEVVLCPLSRAEPDACPGRRDRDHPPEEVGRGVGVQLDVARVHRTWHVRLHPGEVGRRAPEAEHPGDGTPWPVGGDEKAEGDLLAPADSPGQEGGPPDARGADL